MKKLKKLAKWILISVLILVVILGTTIGMRQNLKFDAPYPNVHASADSNIIKRGKHIVFSQAHCASCHSPQNVDSLQQMGIEPALNGGRLLDIGIAKIYTPNITSDKIYGIGRRTDGEIARVIRYGVHANGNAVLNFMGFQDMSDDDLVAVISYLRTVKPIATPNIPHDFNLLGKAIRAFMVKPVGPGLAIKKSVTADSSAAYGEYLVSSTTNCMGCHTQRNLAGEFSGPLMAGGNDIDGFTTPNLTPHPDSRIYGWTEQDFIDRFRQPKRIKESPMPWSSFKLMTDPELKAIYKYLQTVPAAKMPEVEK
ncbi:MAG: c-type cytochrome [Ferruginibacter sp.]